MAQALEKLYFDKELCERLGRGAREKAEREYDWDKLGDKLNEIYIATLSYKKVL
jgi:glycosyltransferase involved in cell wall biosynthesis